MKLGDMKNFKCRVKIFNCKGELKETKTGVITATTSHLLIVSYENNVRDCYNIGGLLTDKIYEVSLRVNKEWVTVKELLRRG